MTSRLAATAAAAAVAAASLLGLSAPAIAQTSGTSYTAVMGGGITDRTVTPGQTVTATSGEGAFKAGTTVRVSVVCPGYTQDLGTATADGDGEATKSFTLRSDARPGRCEVVFAAGNSVRVPFTVVSAAAASTGRGQLPRTGSDDLASLTAAGVALVAAGSLVVVAARRRREDVPAGVA